MFEEKVNTYVLKAYLRKTGFNMDFKQYNIKIMTIYNNYFL